MSKVTQNNLGNNLEIFRAEFPEFKMYLYGVHISYRPKPEFLKQESERASKFIQENNLNLQVELSDSSFTVKEASKC